MQDSNLKTPSLSLLQAHFPGQFAIPFVAAAVAAGLDPRSARNRLSEGKFPIATFRQGGLRFVHLLDLAEYLDKKRGEAVAVPLAQLPADPPKKRRGRPTKTEQVARAQLLRDSKTVNFIAGHSDAEGGVK